MFAWVECHNCPSGEVKMAGKIALGLLCAIILGATCFAAGWYRREETKIECRVMRIVTEEDATVNNPGGLKPPYTIVGRGFRADIHTLPGIVGDVGEMITIHQ